MFYLLYKSSFKISFFLFFSWNRNPQKPQSCLWFEMCSISLNGWEEFLCIGEASKVSIMTNSTIRRSSSGLNCSHLEITEHLFLNRNPFILFRFSKDFILSFRQLGEILIKLNGSFIAMPQVDFWPSYTEMSLYLSCYFLNICICR